MDRQYMQVGLQSHAGALPDVGADQKMAVGDKRDKEVLDTDLRIDIGHKLELAGGGRCRQIVAGHRQLGQLLLLLQVRELRRHSESRRRVLTLSRKRHGLTFPDRCRWSRLLPHDTCYCVM